MIGACHPAYCVLLGLACWLEYHLSLGDNTGTDFLFGIDGVNDAKRINDRARTLVNAIINAEGFDQVMDAIEDFKKGYIRSGRSLLQELRSVAVQKMKSMHDLDGKPRDNRMRMYLPKFLTLMQKFVLLFARMAQSTII